MAGPDPAEASDQSSGRSSRVPPAFTDRPSVRATYKTVGRTSYPPPKKRRAVCRNGLPGEFTLVTGARLGDRPPRDDQRRRWRKAKPPFGYRAAIAKARFSYKLAHPWLPAATQWRSATVTRPGAHAAGGNRRRPCLRSTCGEFSAGLHWDAAQRPSTKSGSMAQPTSSRAANAARRQAGSSPMCPRKTCTPDQRS